jgi:hypothetical protein
MANGSTPPSPQKITGELMSGFRSAALLGALQLELFTALGAGRSPAKTSLVLSG